MESRTARRLTPTLIVVAALTLGFTACSNGDSSSADGSASEAASASAPATGATTVGVTLSEFAVALDATSAPAGTVTFNVTNSGPDDVHEFVIVQTDLGLTELPTDEDGAVIEESEGLTPVDEVEDVAVGASEDLTVDLEAGNYVLICNIVQKEPDGSMEAHYAEGMRASFTVS